MLSSPFRFLPFGAVVASGNVNIAKQQYEEISPSSTVTLDVDATPSAEMPEHDEEAIRIARNDLSETLTTVGGIEQVVAFDAPADYTMAVRFDKVILVLFAARHFIGVYGAVNVLEGDVSLVDNTNGVELTSSSATIKGPGRLVFRECYRRLDRRLQQQRD